ncbi:Uu.00g100620.m01.CDS01 [Anthostomella pinea]|uniref:Uu.00g100620.m01.CDS01 n=1 Tax=Anthostomella pinea TaxID=933095 RepID=A0AAI8YFC5_9PEZI|nr:Uu.00g100620.m01.CDS01 [Anthostomella pinea]
MQPTTLLLLALSAAPASAFDKTWISTQGDRTECGEQIQENADLPAENRANTADCKQIADVIGVSEGYWRTYDWVDNADPRYTWVDLEFSGNCVFSVKHADPKSTADIRVGNADIEDYIRIALRDGDHDGQMAQHGTFYCQNARDFAYTELLEWRVWKYVSHTDRVSATSSKDEEK